MSTPSPDMLARLNAIEIQRETEADIDDLRPLWVSVHHAHRAAMPELGPFDQFARIGIHDLIVGVLPGNEGAVRLYQRRGFRPTWLYLSRFAGRDS
jgi:hypothetical protein